MIKCDVCKDKVGSAITVGYDKNRGGVISKTFCGICYESFLKGWENKGFKVDKRVL